MIRSSNAPLPPLFLGIEGGGTRTVALLADSRQQAIHRCETGPANLKLLSETQLLRRLRSLSAEFPRPDAVAIGLAGAINEADRQRIRSAAGKVWQGVPCHPTNDLETGLAAATENAGAGETRVLILSGTGSCCYGRGATGKIAKIGGWGHILGDKGSAYEIGLRALKAVVYYRDRDGEWSGLGARLLATLQLNEPEDLVGWVQKAEKTAVAALALEVFAAWKAGDRIARDILAGAATSLAGDALACAGQLAPKGEVKFVLSGSVLIKQPDFARKVTQLLRKSRPGAQVIPLDRESVWGAVRLAQEVWKHSQPAVTGAGPESPRLRPAPRHPLPELPLADMARLSPTEQRNPRSLHLDRLPLNQAIELMINEDARIPQAILAERDGIARAIQFITTAFKRGGRLFYAGAGTSGRLGVLDASECPPTFSTDPELVQGLLAGGQEALWRSLEGAEDDAPAGARAVAFRNAGRRDVVVGIAASGRTPFVWGALGEARRRGAKTVLLCFNPHLNIPKAARPDVVIAPDVGPEVLTGSTRLKAGTATKLILNMLTTLSMVRIGKVASNLMIDLNPSNVKLRDRAVRIVRDLKGVDYDAAKAALEKSGWVIKAACAGLRPRRATVPGRSNTPRPVAVSLSPTPRKSRG